jgi:hemerythrin superfamily protein
VREQGVVSRVVETVSNIFTGEGAQTSAIDLLKEDHDRVEDLFSRVKDNEDGDNRDFFAQIRRELDTHTHIEEQIFYPRLLNLENEELQRLTREALVEHGQVKMILEELGTFGEDREAFNAKLKVLIEDVEHHVEDEEGEMFPLVQDNLDEEALNDLGRRMQEEKARFGNTTRVATAVG